MKVMFRERNSFLLGLGFLMTVTLVVTAALNVNRLADQLGSEYHAIVAEAGGLKAGDAVRVNGVKVGRVTDVSLADKGVDITFSITNADAELGEQTSAAIKVATVLGDKELSLTSAGGGRLMAGGTIPLSRTDSPYDLPTALSDLTREAGALDTKQVSSALDTVATTLEGVPQELGKALRGVERLARTLNSRDQEILQLATHTEQFSGILSDRSAQLKRLVEDGNVLFAELEFRQQAIGDLLRNITPFAQELRGLVADNRRDFGPALDRLNRVIAVLRQNRGNLDATLNNLADYSTALGEAVGSGNFFTSIVQNLLPGNLVPTSPTDLQVLLGGVLSKQSADTTGRTR